MSFSRLRDSKSIPLLGQSSSCDPLVMQTLRIGAAGLVCQPWLVDSLPTDLLTSKSCEPASPAQIRHARIRHSKSGRPDLNRRPLGPQPSALPNYATPRYFQLTLAIDPVPNETEVVDSATFKRATGIEPALRAWKALVQPQHFARKYQMIEPSHGLLEALYKRAAPVRTPQTP